MANNKAFDVLGTQNNVYVDRSGQAVNGYAVRVLLVEFDEVHTVNVPNLQAETVKTAVESLLSQRRALVDLG